jgi:hypothetical protein
MFKLDAKEIAKKQILNFAPIGGKIKIALECMDIKVYTLYFFLKEQRIKKQTQLANITLQKALTSVLGSAIIAANKTWQNGVLLWIESNCTQKQARTSFWLVTVGTGNYFHRYIC